MEERNIGIAIDLSATSKYALGWSLEHLARDGDHIVVIIVKKKESSDSHLFEKSGTPLFPLHDDKEGALQKYGIAADPEVFALIHQVRDKRKITVDGKVYFGDAREKILDAINDLKLHFLAIGSRGLGTVKRALLGSVSNYVINNAPCPVTVIKLPPSATTSS